MKHHSFHTPDACTACTVCVAHCPVAKASLNFRGPKMTGPAYERFRLLGLGDDSSLTYCSNCKNCDISCPSGVSPSTFNMRALAEYSKTTLPSPRDWVLAHSGDLGKPANCLPATLLNYGMNNPLSRFLLHLAGIDRHAPLPGFAPLRLRKKLAARASSPADVLSAKGKIAAFFPGCFIRYYEPQAGLDCIRLLEMAGYTVIIPKNFSCCGLPLVAGGFVEDALDKARINNMELSRLKKRDIPLITACPSCTLMLKQELRELFPEEGLEDVASHIMDACDFLASLARKGALSLKNARPEQTRIAYHAPCHLRIQGMGRTGLDLLRMLPGLTTIDTDAGCCGISGSYGFKRGKYEIGMAVGNALFTAIKETNAPLSASECGTCRAQMRHGGGIPAMHPISIVLQSLQG
ncbi:sn-glycerol-3-phosphate dehydrogenase subunit C [Deltaproteobacteria bacterium]|nr:sn-glycerol-3-phosphate dehydrogenase subunit C [Deltaproteobacteria bacterium]